MDLKVENDLTLNGTGADLWRVELDSSLSLHEGGGELHDDGFNGVGGGPALRSHELHAEGTSLKHVASMKDGMHHPNEWRFEGKRILKTTKGNE